MGWRWPAVGCRAAEAEVWIARAACGRGKTLRARQGGKRAIPGRWPEQAQSNSAFELLRLRPPRSTPRAQVNSFAGLKANSPTSNGCVSVRQRQVSLLSPRKRLRHDKHPARLSQLLPSSSPLRRPALCLLDLSPPPRTRTCHPRLWRGRQRVRTRSIALLELRRVERECRRRGFWSSSRSVPRERRTRRLQPSPLRPHHVAPHPDRKSVV